MTPNKIAQARAMYDAGGHTVQQIADAFGVSRPTIYRHLAERAGAGAGPAKLSRVRRGHQAAGPGGQGRAAEPAPGRRGSG